MSRKLLVIFVVLRIPFEIPLKVIFCEGANKWLTFDFSYMNCLSPVQ